MKNENCKKEKEHFNNDFQVNEGSYSNVWTEKKRTF